MNKISSYRYGWIGLRALKLGNSARLLKKLGFMKQSSAQLNNRNGFNYVLPFGVKRIESFDFNSLKNKGFEGLAIYFTDAQWKYNAGITDKQWQGRIVIER